MLTKNLNPFLWNALDQFGSQVLNLVLGIMMLRYLTPNDYGLFVIPFLIYNLLKTFQDLGSHDLIFRSSEFNLGFLKQILGFTLVISLIIIGIAFILPAKFYELISKSFQTDRTYLLKLIPLLIITAFNLSFEFYCRKTLQFNLTAVSNLISTILAGLFGIYLAMNGFKTDSLLYKQIMYVVLYFILMLLITKGLILPSFRLKSVWKERNFYLPLFTSQILAFASRNLDNIFVGKYLGIQKLGLYDRAYKFLSTPLGQIGGTFHKVLLPILTKLSPDKSRMQEVFCNFLHLISLILFPFLFLLVALAEEIVLSIFGLAWIEATEIIQIFSIAACYQSIGGLNYGIILLDNKTNLYKNLMIIFNTLYVFIFIFFTKFFPNLYFLVLCYSIATFFFNVYIFKITSKYFNINIFHFAKVIAKPLLLSFILFLIITILKELIRLDSVLDLITTIILAYGLYLAMYFLFFNKSYQQILSFMKESNFLIQTSENSSN